MCGVGRAAGHEVAQCGGVGRAAGHEHNAGWLEVAQCAGWGGLPAMRWHNVRGGAGCRPLHRGGAGCRP